MRTKQRKEAVQVFELDQEEAKECFVNYLKTKGAVIPEGLQFMFQVKIGAVNRQIESIKITTKLVEEGEGLPGSVDESSKTGKAAPRMVTLVKS